MRSTDVAHIELPDYHASERLDVDSEALGMDDQEASEAPAG
jgi:hypothetical protein